MIDLLVFSLVTYFRYLLLYFYFYFAGRSLIILIEKIFLANKQLPKILLSAKINIFYPILGLIFIGNLLILFHFFIPLKSIAIFFLLLLALLPNFYNVNKEINFKNLVTVNNFFYFVLIPSILLISSSDINFHYDAAYYHLNNQNWLRESNLIIGFVNIFWPFGMSSIYEYLSSILWFEGSLIFLHYLSLIFVHFFYSFIYYQVFISENKFLRNGSILLLFFSILDNFGYMGGRNGFIYIQEVGKQDIPVAILLSVTSLLIVSKFKEEKIESLDVICISLISLFIIQLKVSGVYIFYLYLFLFVFCIRKNLFSIKKLMIFQIPLFSFSIIWLVKNYLTTGCLIFPLSLTCKNTFSWYVDGSTEKVEEYTTATSFAFMEYFIDPNLTFVMWFNEFFYSEKYSVFTDYYRSVYLNFLFSLMFVFFVKIILFKKYKNEKSFFYISTSYIFISVMYLIFFGPIPRYTIGILCSVILLLGFSTNDFRFKVNKLFLYAIFLISIGLLPRLNSYINFIETKNIALSDPRPSNEVNRNISTINWVKPESGDRCWIDLNCTMEEGNIKIHTEGFFKTASKK